MTNIASDVLRLWLAEAVALSAQRLLVADPTVQSLLVQNGVNIQAISGSSQGYGKRKRSVKTSFAVGRGRKKGRR
jgi:hypothetical protein